ncbi:tRNA (N(6)-L-threonylcarbamoyladenosine(37)-C(2))-methylthiotransferase MtaB [Elioraea rosea]|uniref:tRNA (N(6)-L-threonylcarbamoyladenosine(37)-C(2))- methylthiotransferase MtaB n=1 Tax=Elioraea rosea TaxID=2492390 RepID=UPI001184FED6|nr:tRNA (N(6)-L-threonylcarbamoyladenosine(37)-C(2))-methylthiotransferase MtaB [Elioraea rosea]
MSVRVLNFGCRLNTWEGEVMRGHAQEAGLADTIIVNTCAVTAEAERQARQAVRKARRENPSATIVVTGCAAQIRPDAWGAMAEVDRVVGNQEKLEAATWIGVAHPRVAVSDIMQAREAAAHLVTEFAGRARAFVQVQQGCDHRCTFCIIPYGRGPSRSVAIGEVVAQARALTEAGYQELVLTGVDITAYGPDLPGAPTLGQMIRRLLALVPELKRLRLSSLDPVEIDDDLWRLIAEEPRLMPHLHLSVQAGDDMILKRMKRRHLRADVLAVTRRARDLRPGIAFGADLIAGFPTETEAMAANTRALVEEAGLDFLHVFPFSAREGTPAARMPQLDGRLISERAARLREAGEAASRRFYEGRVGAEAELLVEREGEGHTEHFAPARLVSGSVAPGRVGRVRITAAGARGLLAEAA